MESHNQAKRVIKIDHLLINTMNILLLNNYRSVNMTNQHANIANIKEIENKKRYQYHKRIHSDTGNAMVSPLEHIYDRSNAAN